MANDEQKRIEKLIAKAYRDACGAGTGDEGGSCPIYPAAGADMILGALDAAGFKIVPKGSPRKSGVLIID